MGIFGGLNSYAYSFNNPLYWVDPWGLWSTRAHNYLISKYGERNGLTETQMRAMREGSAIADSIVMGRQGARSSFIHAMTSEAITSKREACKLANQFVDQELGAFNAKLAGNFTPSAGGHRGRIQSQRSPFFHLGVAMHTIMDSTSPSHQGFQFWASGQIPRHGADTFIGIPRRHTEESLSALRANPDLITQTVDLMEQAVNGRRLDCSCFQ